MNIHNIPDDIVQSMTQAGVWSDECPVPIKRLLLLEILHYNFESEVKTGQMIVLDSIADRVMKIFEQLFKLRFPIHQMQLMEHYNGSDELSMEANNSSCLNYRKIHGTDRLSIHSYGLAIDINPKQNPYIIFGKDGKASIFPHSGSEFLNRRNLRPGMLELVVEIFTTKGFSWGGDWNDPIDYHHFQISPQVFGL